MQTSRKHRRPIPLVSISGHAAVTALLLFAASPMADADTLTVTNGHDHGPGSLRVAIANAADDDVIEFAGGFRSVNLTTDRLLISQKHLTIKGPGAKQLTVLRKAALAFGVFEILGGKVTLSGLTIANGLVNHYGGGIYAFDTTLTLSDCVVSHNRGTGGAGIYNGRGTITIKGCVIFDNAATEIEGGSGGGFYNSGTATIARSTFSRNSTPTGVGGAIINYGLVTITNSTVAGNSAAGSAGGIYNAPGTASEPHIVKARNTIIAENTDAGGSPDFSGRLKSLGYNLIGSTNGISISGNTTGNQRNVDPRLGPLQDNGGPTFTRALLSDSPAIDKGDSGSSVIDQRRFLRPVDHPDLPNANGGNGSDIGAFEVEATPTTAP